MSEFIVESGFTTNGVGDWWIVLNKGTKIDGTYYKIIHVMQASTLYAGDGYFVGVTTEDFNYDLECYVDQRFSDFSEASQVATSLVKRLDSKDLSLSSSGLVSSSVFNRKYMK